MPNKKQKIEKHFFTIGEVAELLGESTSTIRYWENQFDFLNPQRNKKDNRLFTQKDIETVRFIHHLLKEQGLTISGAKQKLKSQRAELSHNYDVVKRLKEIRQDLIDLTDAMEE